MFQFYKHIVSFEYDKETNLHYHYLKIVDTNFEEVSAGDQIYGSRIEIEVIEAYRRRNLPVVPNLIRCWQFECKRYCISMGFLIEFAKKCNPYYSEYENEINKYLLLL